MIQSGGYRGSDSPYIDRVWHARIVGKGVMTLPAKSNWDLMIVRGAECMSAVIAGPRSHATVMNYDEDSEYIGIEFKMGVHFRPFHTTSMVNNAELLPAARRASFWLGDTRLEFPTYENIEAFVENLQRNNLLQNDVVIRQTLSGSMRNLSPRTVQRHFLLATGLTHKRYQQITRAQNAVEMLKAGTPPIEAAYELGYSDQFHLSRSLRTLIGQTPSQIRLSFE